MTKTLTEKWREGTLEDGFYYIKKNMCGIKDIKTEELFSGEFCTVPNEYIEEVLAPVPDYMDCKRLMYDSVELEKENKRLQEQLNEANEVIKGYAECYKKYPDGTMFSFEVRKHPAHSYLEKWGVK